jgi:hypothetical protein
MFSNVQRTAQELYDEVIWRLARYRTRENLDYDNVMKYINNAIKELYVLLLPYREYAYHSSLQVQHLDVLPTSYYKHIRLIINVRELDPATGYVEARYVTPREYYTITSWHQAQDWNKARITNPVFTIWNYGQNSSNAILSPDLLQILISPNISLTYPNPPITTDLVGTLEYYGLPNDLVNETDALDLPAMFEEFVITAAINRFLFKAVQGQDVKNYIKSLQEQKASFQQRMDVLEYNVKRELDSFLVPVAPYKMVEALPGELPSQLA